jgi:hypothetical protein
VRKSRVIYLEQKFTDQNLYVFAKLQEKKRKICSIQNEIKRTVRKRPKAAHNPDVLKNSLVFLCARLRNFHTAVVPFNLSGIVHRPVEHRNNSSDRR